jgi:hypothetical protein
MTGDTSPEEHSPAHARADRRNGARSRGPHRLGLPSSTPRRADFAPAGAVS